MPEPDVPVVTVIISVVTKTNAAVPKIDFPA